MYRKLLLSILYSYVYSCATAQDAKKDSIRYSIAHDSIHHIVFDFPEGWPTRSNIPRVMFYADDTTMSFRNFRTNLTYMKYWKIAELPVYIDKRAELIQKQSKNVTVIEKQILFNQHGIQYGRIKNYSSHKGLTGYKTHIYFAKGDSYFLISFANLETDEEKYNPVVEHIIQSIQFYGTPDANEVEEVGK